MCPLNLVLNNTVLMPSLSLRNGSSVSSFAHNFLVSSLATLLRGTVYNYKARCLNFVSITVIKCPDFKKLVEKGVYFGLQV